MQGFRKKSAKKAGGGKTAGAKRAKIGKTGNAKRAQPGKTAGAKRTKMGKTAGAKRTKMGKTAGIYLFKIIRQKNSVRSYRLLGRQRGAWGNLLSFLGQKNIR